MVKPGPDADIRRNYLEAECPGWAFDSIRRASDAIWETEFNKIQVSGGTDDEYTTFNPAMYHSLLSPSILGDVD